MVVCLHIRGLKARALSLGEVAQPLGRQLLPAIEREFEVLGIHKGVFTLLAWGLVGHTLES